MADEAGTNAKDVLASYRAGAQPPLYFIGTFNAGVTVLSQQIRALNLVWALVESNTIACHASDSPRGDQATRVAVVGGGFAGLTFAAGLLAKRAKADITIFEQRDTLLPLQQGSDSRWLHPHIYDWPSTGSEASAAMLPVLNWTAARASDVVVQVLREWRSVLDNAVESHLKPTLYCNTRHVQVHRAALGTRLRIEWVGERRDAGDGTIDGSGLTTVGRLEEFDLVVLAVGFGPERDHGWSYWRNETFAQPSLEQARVTYLVSGQGDGAMIDLLRLRVSQFRQDRILSELFDGADTLLGKFRELHKEYGTGTKSGMFDALERLEATDRTEFQRVSESLARRLRRDTDVVLRVRVETFSQLFEPETVRMSFQNRLLVYLLYKCGGFSPSHVESDKDLMQQHGIPNDRVIRRHGPQPKEHLRSVLSAELFRLIVPDPAGTPALTGQSDEVRWNGGYFRFPGTSAAVSSLPDELKAWRKDSRGNTVIRDRILCRPCWAFPSSSFRRPAAEGHAASGGGFRRGPDASANVRLFGNA